MITNLMGQVSILWGRQEHLPVNCLSPWQVDYSLWYKKHYVIKEKGRTGKRTLPWIPDSWLPALFGENRNPSQLHKLFLAWCSLFCNKLSAALWFGWHWLIELWITLSSKFIMICHMVHASDRDWHCSQEHQRAKRFTEQKKSCQNEILHWSGY